VGLLEGRRAIVTGGASGIGLAVARRLAAEGARIAIFDVDGAGAAAAAREVSGLAFAVDVTEAEAVDAATAAAVRGLGGIDVLVNNAGVGALRPLHEVSPAEFDRLLRVNLTGVYNALRSALPRMLEGDGGAVVNNASGSAARPTRGELPYSAAKAGVVALTQGAAQEYGPRIRVNCVSPGVIRTPMSEALFQIPKLLDPVVRATPLGRTGTAEEVADAILFLASDLSRFVTGQTLTVDGGLGLPQAGIDDVLRGLLSHASRTSRGGPSS
jgi:NAD(P)-dependent dehydrogenase (short-subunit alcohol dehydrogenase family)